MKEQWKFRISFINVGNGDAILLEMKDATLQKGSFVMLVDGGLALCACLRTIDTFRLFEKVNILTGGGPANSTSTITQFMYIYGIKTFKFGFASACAIVMTILVLLLSGFYIRKAMR